MQYHILVSRINPALKIDLIRFCTIEDGQARSFTVKEFAKWTDENDFRGLDNLFEISDISDSMYIQHSRISELIDYLSKKVAGSIDFFDNNLVIVFDYGTETEKEER